MSKSIRSGRAPVYWWKASASRVCNSLLARVLGDVSPEGQARGRSAWPRLDGELPSWDGRVGTPGEVSGELVVHRHLLAQTICSHRGSVARVQDTREAWHHRHNCGERRTFVRSARGAHGPHSWQKRAPMAWRHGPYTQGACRERGATSGVHAPAVPRPAPACHPLRCLHRSHCHAWRPSWPRRGASAPLHTRHACVIEPGSTAGPWSSLILGGWGVSKTQHPLHSTAHTTCTHSGNSSQALSPAKACAGPFRGGHEQPTMVEGEAPVCPSTPPSASHLLSRARLPVGL